MYRVAVRSSQLVKYVRIIYSSPATVGTFEPVSRVVFCTVLARNLDSRAVVMSTYTVARLLLQSSTASSTDTKSTAPPTPHRTTPHPTATHHAEALATSHTACLTPTSTITATSRTVYLTSRKTWAGAGSGISSMRMSRSITTKPPPRRPRRPQRGWWGRPTWTEYRKPNERCARRARAGPAIVYTTYVEPTTKSATKSERPRTQRPRK